MNSTFPFLPNELWEIILTNDTTNVALDLVNHDWRNIMYNARKHFPHGNFHMPFKRLWYAKFDPDKKIVILNTSLFDNREEGNDSCIFSIDFNMFATLCRSFYDENMLHPIAGENTLFEIHCDKYKKNIEFCARLTQSYSIMMRFPFSTNVHKKQYFSQITEYFY